MIWDHMVCIRLNTVPAIAEKGEEGGEAWLDLELKVGRYDTHL
jgi:hypothetical protein